MAEAFRFDVRVAIWADDSIPFVRLDDALGKRIVAVPFADYLSRRYGPREFHERVAAIAAQFPDHQVKARFVGEDRAFIVPAAWSGDREATALSVELASAEHAWQRFAPAFRRNVRKAERSGVHVTVDSGGDAIDRFQAMLVAYRREKFGLATPPMALFERLHARFSAAGGCFIVEARTTDRVLAAVMLLGCGDHLWYKFGASAIADDRALRPNNLVFWRIIQEFSGRFARLNLGMNWTGQDGEDGVIRFKRSMGATERTVTILTRRPDGFSALDFFRSVSHFALSTPMPAAVDNCVRRSLFRHFH